MEEERLKQIGPTTDLSAEELYREEPFSHDEYVKDNGELDVPAFIIRTTEDSSPAQTGSDIYRTVRVLDLS